MPTREEMRSLAQDIVRSYEDRVTGVKHIKSAVGTMLKGFDQAHAAMARELKADLAKVPPALRKAEAERHQSEAQRIAERKSDVGTMLKGFDQAHAAMSQELKADLAKVPPALRKAEAERHQTEAQRIAERKSDVGTMLQGFDQAHAAMSRELKADLAKVPPALRKAEAERHQSEAQRIAERKSDVGTMLKGFREEQAGVRDEWQKLTATMQAKRGVAVVEMKPPEAVAPPPVEEVAEEEALAAEVPEPSPQLSEVRHQVFAYLADHPDGTKMTEMEQEFGLSRIEMAMVVRNLMDNNKIEKRDLKYFAI